MIRPVKRRGKTYYQLISSSGRVLGTHATEREAEKQELAIHLSLLRAAGRIGPRKGSKKSRTRGSR